VRVIIAGGRDITGPGYVAEAMMLALREWGDCSEVTEVVSGGAAGVDRLGERWARGRQLPVRVFKADWERYRLAAGPRRNAEMAAYADALVAVWDGRSRGTADMIRRARERGLRVYIHRVGT
jgi:hypothetical protein